ncbi:FAD-dependent oxidoreductase [Aspergillus ibericus CBS 121593]|uniref:FAD/NAD(P)-binding domain-containing protein n=1 Tax=Aspergillus ibericus CBS 121593 TaxID=1448316 RepID=A0A395H6I5_9EURO|nr:FAD/NAD(P)-binding domain-containing protein [Aspergillus ibericus CBS 121593]RAL02478.1 FAD/NAD(P)-binding domain-containing protein [Aspergillus ibericus CBS 121593]
MTSRPGKRVAIVGGGPGAISTGLAFLQRGYDVSIYELQPVCKAIGGAVLLSTPVLAILRSYGLDLTNVGAPTVTYFKNKAGTDRVKLPFNTEVERRMGIKGWHYGVLRSSIFQKMLDLVFEGVIHADHKFTSYIKHDDYIELFFKNSHRVTADILISTDGIRSKWVVKPSWKGKPVPDNLKAYLTSILKDWAQPIPRFLEVTNFTTHVYRWEIYNRPSMKTWSSGRVVCVRNTMHPVSPYAAYGMGIAIEDGYFLARELDGVDLRDVRAVSAGFELYEKLRVDYVNHHMEFARFSGHLFHSVPRPLAYLRDWVFDYTPLLSGLLKRNYLRDAEEQSLRLTELQVC